MKTIPANQIGAETEKFRMRCAGVVGRWCRREINLHNAVDGLQAESERSGLLAAIGQDHIQWIMAEAFRPCRRAGDNGIYARSS